MSEGYLLSIAFFEFICFIEVNTVEEEVVYEEVPQPHVIETGDSVKVKQVLDDATIAAITDAGYEGNYSWDDKKLLLMFVACVFAMIAQFYPMPFPKSRPLLAVCCAMYFIISGVLQFIVTFIDKDTIMFTKAKPVMKSQVTANCYLILTGFRA